MRHSTRVAPPVASPPASDADREPLALGRDPEGPLVGFMLGAFATSALVAVVLCSLLFA